MVTHKIFFPGVDNLGVCGIEVSQLGYIFSDSSFVAVV